MKTLITVRLALEFRRNWELLEICKKTNYIIRKNLAVGFKRDVGLF